jgi:LacI family transcriptional regulator
MSKEITIYDIAEALDLSPATVSRGLKDHPAIKKDTKKRIVDKAREMGYQHNHFASNLRKNKTNTIGLIVPRLNSYFMSTVIAGIEKVANEEGYNLIISQSLESVQKEMINVRTLFNSRVDGLLVSAAYDTENEKHFDVFLQKKIPLIFFDRVLSHPDCTNIVIDNYKAGYEVTSHLIEQGCKDIVHVTASLRRNVYADRLRGYRQALEDNGISYDEKKVIFCNLGDAAGISVAETILAMNPLPDGIFSANDSCAVSCLKRLKEAGIKIPEQIAIAGFNNDPLSKVIEPNLTTVNYPGMEMGELAAILLIRRINKTEESNMNTMVLKHNLLIRGSSLRDKNSRK